MHDGHRERMRERIIASGIDNLQPHEVLEYVLYYAVPRKDTNVLAHELINKYGSFSRVLTADVDDLVLVKDMTKNAALFLTSLPSLLRLYMRDLSAEKQHIRTRADCIRTLSPYFLGEKTEKFYALCLDADNNVINCVQLATGIPAQVNVDVREIVNIAIKQKAVSVVLAHNHPSGKCAPSYQDIEFTKTVGCALQLIKVRLLDHVILCDEGYFSFAEEGLVNIISDDVARFLKEGVKY